MKKQKYNHFILTFLLIIGIVVTHSFLAEDWSKFDHAQAAIMSGPEQNASASSNSNQDHAVTGIDAHGNFVIAWEARGQNGLDIFYRRFDFMGKAKDSQNIMANTTTDGDQKNPSLAMDKNGNFIVVWEGKGSSDNDGIFGQAFSENGAKVGGEFMVNTKTKGAQILPKVATNYSQESNNGSFAVTWEDTEKTNDILLQRFETDFTQTQNRPKIEGANTIVNFYATGGQNNPAIAMNNFGEIIVTWNGTGTGFENSSQAWLQAYGSDGKPWGKEDSDNKNIRVNSNNIASAQRPNITSDKSSEEDGGNFIISYEGISTSDDSDGGIFARRIGRCNPKGCTINVSELAINTDTHDKTFSQGVQLFTRVDADALGNFIIVWEDAAGHDGNGHGIFGQSYKSTGQRLEEVGSRSQFTINSTTNSNQRNPSIAMTPDGSSVTVYSDDESRSIKYQLYTSTLFKAGTEQLANAGMESSQAYEVDTAVAPNGESAAVWLNLNDHHLYFTIWNQNHEKIASNIIVDDKTVNNQANHPSISFFKDITGNSVGRFIIAWEGKEPACYNGADAAGLDIWYREFNSNGEAQGNCEKKINTMVTNDGDQIKPDLSAGYYNNDQGDVEDIFAVTYLHQPVFGDHTLETRYHDQKGFSGETLESNCANCKNLQISLNPENNHIVTIWDNNKGLTKQAWARPMIKEKTVAPAFLINATSNTNQTQPDVAFLTNDQFLVTFTESNTDDSTAHVTGKRYQFNENGTPRAIESSMILSTETITDSLEVNGRIAVDTNTGNFLIVWATLPPDLFDNQIYGQFFQYANNGPKGIQKYGPPFRINSTQEGNQSFPSVSMNNKETVLVGWEGRMDNARGDTTISNNSIVVQALRNPLRSENFPSIEPIASQEILQGGRRLTVPTTINFPATTVSTSGNSPTVYVSTRDATHVAPVQYIEVEDLDGTSFNITISVSDFKFKDGKNYIHASDLGIKNCDAVSPLDDVCIEALQGNASDILLNPTINDYKPFTSNSEQKTLATKTNSNLGKWRLRPSFSLSVPALTPPGDHSATITVSLQ